MARTRHLPIWRTAFDLAAHLERCVALVADNQIGYLNTGFRRRALARLRRPMPPSTLVSRGKS